MLEFPVNFGDILPALPLPALEEAALKPSSTMGSRHSSTPPDLINTLLPPEMLRQIFSQLAPADLKTVVLVCQLWREVGEAPGLWTWAVMTATGKNKSSMPERLVMRRLLRVRILVMESEVELSEELLGVVEGHLGLSCLIVRKVDLTWLRPARLASLLDRLTGISLIGTQLTAEQLLAIFTNSQNTAEPWRRKNQGPVKTLILADNDLSLVEPKVLASAVNKLCKLRMRNTQLTTQQIDAVFTSTSITTSLQCLDLGHNDLSSVDPALLARAVTRASQATK